MNSVPIFDSLTHPTLDGRWMGKKSNLVNTAEKLLEEMAEHDIAWALAVGMGGVGGYDENSYATYIRGQSERRQTRIVQCNFMPTGHE